MTVNTINDIDNLNKFINDYIYKKHIKIFGSGFICNSFFDYIEEKGYRVEELTECIIVSSLDGNESPSENVPLIEYDEKIILDGDVVFIAVSYKNAPKLAELFTNKSVDVYYADFSISDHLNRDHIYSKVKNSINEFIKNYRQPPQPKTANSNNKKYIWSCWWQGVENAPEIVKACINSQIKNKPEDAEYIIITEKNYKDYIDIPEHIIEKVNKKYISLTTLSDIIRFSLLYKYGGLWIDSTVLLHEKMPSEWLDYDLFTCKGKNYHFASYSEVSLWFIGGKAGNELFSFVREAFLDYYKHYNKIKYYLMVDYLIKTGFEIIPTVNNQYLTIPFNNENADVLKYHLNEKYKDVCYQNYISDTYLQKLTYKFSNDVFFDDSIYNYIRTEYSTII